MQIILYMHNTCTEKKGSLDGKGKDICCVSQWVGISMAQDGTGEENQGPLWRKCQVSLNMCSPKY